MEVDVEVLANVESPPGTSNDIMYDGPIREGSRGGRDQFSWESVKGDKDREFYLGHSVKALVGHWQKNKDPYWYAKDKRQHDSKLKDEVKAVKQREEELMLEALGIKKVTKRETTDFGKKLQKYEVDELLKRREKEDGDAQETEDLGPRGLGFRRTALALATSTTHEVLEGVGIAETVPQRRPPNRPPLHTPVESAREGKRKKKEREKKERKPHRREEKSRSSREPYAERHRHRSRSPHRSTRSRRSPIRHRHRRHYE